MVRISVRKGIGPKKFYDTQLIYSFPYSAFGQGLHEEVQVPTRRGRGGKLSVAKIFLGVFDNFMAFFDWVYFPGQEPPVPTEYRNEMWKMFSSSSSKITFTQFPQLLVEKVANYIAVHSHFAVSIGFLNMLSHCYEKAISHSPLKGWRKYLGLAQLLEGKESLLQYTRGIEVMEREVADKFARDNPQPDPFASMKSPSETSAQAATEVPSDYPTPRDISDAYLSISELYTTDLW